MMSLGRVQYREMDADKLLYMSEQVFNEMIVTGEESNFLFHSTEKQSNSHLWYQHRKGRLTASNFGAICRTSLESPSKSLAESILQQCIVPKTAAMQWGIDMESVAKQAYVKSVKDKHELFEIDDAGLYINPKAPHLGASTDGLISCSCCGLGVLEIKCPYSAKDTVPTSVTYIEAIDGGFKLSKKHDYIARFKVKWLSWNDLIVTLFAGPLLIYICLKAGGIFSLITSREGHIIRNFRR